ncbi:hypothetical protein CLHOM_23780 [Clostridium homopropionicum DSM 5847]|uniref:Uncharacterized protein n=1 Tax=Clostridium homopropionicum DSM 5847 TaxID=1121318 RepID=A0A0L6Z8H8_9CLOT|nr:hypothetical protein [Clostridium homopropionicum]KOA19272.1 hypothetical protein CLHOM_23780 [Clostridium homopropionicum DSM 5847]SFG19362.1 hypothetical protein SAMN04488501_106137 [Clostridium homopropionicum]
MKNCAIEISDKILEEFNGLVKKSGVSQQEFLNYIANLYDINNNSEKYISDYKAYCDSFVA